MKAKPKKPRLRTSAGSVLGEELFLEHLNTAPEWKDFESLLTHPSKDSCPAALTQHADGWAVLRSGWRFAGGP